MIPFATQKLVVGIAVTIAAIYSADQFLARLEQRELHAQAQQAYQNGLRLLRNGDSHQALTQAIDAFRSARSLDRDNTAFQFALADALLREHQPQAAADALSEILDEDSNDGQANLLMARVMNEEQQYAATNAYYHRAIYGVWSRGSGARQVDARVELVRWLAQRGDQKGLLSELIMLEPLVALDKTAGIRRDIPFLYRQAGATTRAIEAYRQWLRENPTDAEAYAGLGETQMQRGDFRGARQAFEHAAELKTTDAALKRRAAEASEALELDPTPRSLSTQEKLARSRRILELTLAAVSQCPGAQPDESPLFTQAQELAGESNQTTNEAAELRLDTAETLWNTHAGDCTVPAEQAAVLTALMRKLAQ